MSRAYRRTNGGMLVAITCWMGRHIRSGEPSLHLPRPKGPLLTLFASQQSSEPIFRGRKMVLQYTDGSPCSSKHRRARSVDVMDSVQERHDLARRKLIDHDDHDDEKDDDDDDKKHDHKDDKASESTRRKSTLISLLCERDALAPKASMAFVGASPDECAYFFELRSPHACGGVSNPQQAVGPGGVFGIMYVRNPLSPTNFGGLSF